MITCKPYDSNINKFENQKFIKVGNKDVSRKHNNQILLTTHTTIMDSLMK